MARGYTRAELLEKNEMSSGDKPYYKVRFERIRALKAVKPDEASKELRESGIWLFYKAVEADDSATAHLAGKDSNNSTSENPAPTVERR